MGTISRATDAVTDAFKGVRTAADALVKSGKTVSGASAAQLAAKYSKLTSAGRTATGAKTVLARAGQGLAKVGKWVGKVVGKALLVWSIVDGVAAFASYTFTSSVEVVPLGGANGNIDKATMAAPFEIPGMKDGKMSGVDSMTFTVHGFGAGNAWIDGGLLDISWTATIDKPPSGLTGYVYQCSSGCSCDASTKTMSGCKCWPVQATLNTKELKKEEAASQGVLGGSLTSI